MMKSLILCFSLLISVGAFADDNVVPTIAELKVQAPSTDFEATPIVESVQTAAKAENEIPVLEPKTAAKTTEGSLRDLMLAAALLGGFGLLVWLGLNKYRIRNVKASQFQMKVLATHHLGPKKSLMVVRVAGESVLIGVTDHNINMLKSLSLLDEDIPEEAPTSFGGVFAKTANHDAPAEAEEAAPAKTESRFSFRKKQEDNSDSEEFTISKIRDVVHRQVRNLKHLE